MMRDVLPPSRESLMSKLTGGRDPNEPPIPPEMPLTPEPEPPPAQPEDARGRPHEPGAPELWPPD